MPDRIRSLCDLEELACPTVRSLFSVCRSSRRTLSDGPGEQPRAAGVAIRVVTALAPDDSPKTVTAFGSPPKAAMLRWTHVSAAI